MWSRRSTDGSDPTGGDLSSWLGSGDKFEKDGKTVKETFELRPSTRSVRRIWTGFEPDPRSNLIREQAARPRLEVVSRGCLCRGRLEGQLHARQCSWYATAAKRLAARATRTTPTTCSPRRGTHAPSRSARSSTRPPLICQRESCALLHLCRLRPSFWRRGVGKRSTRPSRAPGFSSSAPNAKALASRLDKKQARLVKRSPISSDR